MTKRNITLTEKELPKICKKIEASHEKYLKKHHVKLPKLKDSKGNFTKNAIVLCLLAKYQGKAITKTKMTEILRQWDPQQNDMQQARHLAMQSGWYIVSGTRGDDAPQLNPNEYCLISLTEPYPGAEGGTDGHRSARGGKNFAELKEKFDFRCATCGSKEGEKSFLNKKAVTKLQKAHMNPNEPLAMDNMIPQCQICNQAYRDWFIFDGKGRVSDINIKSKYWQKKYKPITDG